MNPRQAKADARVEAAAEWLFKRRFRDRPWPPKFEPIADEWRREARELLAHIDAAQEAEDGG